MKLNKLWTDRSMYRNMVSIQENLLKWLIGMEVSFTRGWEPEIYHLKFPNKNWHMWIFCNFFPQLAHSLSFSTWSIILSFAAFCKVRYFMVTTDILYIYSFSLTNLNYDGSIIIVRDFITRTTLENNSCVHFYKYAV